MPESSVQVEIPKRALFKAAEVCDLVQVQPYVLRSWEAEFPGLGLARSGVVGRVYRRTDVEQVLRIKHLLLVDGLTLAGARRRIEEHALPLAADAAVIDELIGQNARERLTEVRRGLRSILDLLAGAGGEEFRLAPPSPVASTARVRATPASRVKPSRGKTSAANRNKNRNGSARAPHARRR